MPDVEPIAPAHRFSAMRTFLLPAIASTLLTCACTAIAGTIYSVEDLHDPRYAQSFAEAGDSAPVGFLHNTMLGTDERAAIWNGAGTPAAYTSLHPGSGFDWTRAEAAAGDRQFGFGKGPATGGREHALQWSGSAASVLDLHPPAFAVSRILGARGTQQVGIASLDPGGFLQGNRGNNRAVVWTDGAGAVALHPPGHTFSEAFGVYDNVQVGVVDDGAALWRGSADSYVDIAPRGTWFSEAHGVFADTQAGYANVGPNVVGSLTHAFVWSGSADSARDIHPQGFLRSRAFDLSAAGAAGVVTGTSPFDIHAAAWLGPELEFTDLSQLLGPDYTESWAVGINDAGNVYGFALHIPTRKIHALEWSPVPEPGSALLLVFGSAAVLVSRRK